MQGVATSIDLSSRTQRPGRLAILLAWLGFIGHAHTLQDQTDVSLGVAWELDENRAMIR
jgi:hypothetical protein